MKFHRTNPNILMKPNTERFGVACKRLLVSSLLLILLAAAGRETRGAGLTLNVGTTNGVTGTEVVVPVQATALTGISAFQFSFHWNPAVVGFVAVEQFGLPGLGGGNYGTTMTNSGTLTVSWDDPDGASKTLADGSVVFAVRFLITGPTGTNCITMIDGTPTAIEAANENLETVPVTVNSGMLVVGASALALGINTQPQSQTVTAGANVSFTVAATGNGLLTYQWRFNGGNLGGSTASTLTLNNVQTNQAGQYTVVVSDSIGSMTSAVAQLTVNLPADQISPTINIVLPTTNPSYATTTPAFALAGSASDNVGVTQVTWSSSRGPNGTASGATSWNVMGLTLAIGTNLFTVTARDVAGNTGSDAILVTYTPPNTAPTISDITDKTTDRNVATPDLSLTVGDNETAAGSLALSATSSNPALVPLANITFGGNGASRTVRIQPATDMTGTATITIFVSDGALTNSDSFVLTVQEPPIIGLVSHWLFDEASGATALDAIGSNPGTLFNGPARVMGKLGPALRFDGIDDYVNVPDSGALDLSNRMTISLWFKPSQLLNSFSGRKDLLKKLNAYWLIMGYPVSDGKLSFVFNSGSPLVKSATSSWLSNTWYHAAATYDGAQMKIYINGVLEGTVATAVPAVANTAPLQIGGNSDHNIYFPGCIDDVRLYNVAMSASEITGLFMSGTTNAAPVLNPIGNRTIDEGSNLTFTVTAMDSDLPTQTLAFSLDPDPPGGASIHPVTGVFSWTPLELQGPSINTIVVRVTDNGTPTLSTTETITITVNEVNRSPVLPAIASRNVNESVPINFALGASDPDLPAQTLTYTVTGLPSGANLNAAGNFSWTPSEAQGPGTYPMTVVVRDNGVPSLGATQSFTITVQEVNLPPVVQSMPEQTVAVLETMRVTNVVSDSDIPVNQVSFIIADGPKGMRINRFTGAISWTPDRTQAPSTNTIKVVASDDGVPPLSTTNTFRVVVGDFVELGLGAAVIRSGQTGSVPINVLATAHVTNLNALLYSADDRLGSLGLSLTAPELSAGSLIGQGQNTQEMNLGVVSGQTLFGGKILGQLNFTGTSTQSAFVPVIFSNLIAMRPTGIPVPRTLSGAGRVAVIANEPLLEALLSTNQQRSLVLYGKPGAGYVIQTTTQPNNPLLWQTVWQGSLTNLTLPLPAPGGSSGTLYYRAYRQ